MTQIQPLEIENTGYGSPLVPADWESQLCNIIENHEYYLEDAIVYVRQLLLLKEIDVKDDMDIEIKDYD